MLGKNKTLTKEKTELHPRNKHREHYDFAALIKSCAELSVFVKPNEHGNESIDFFNPQAVKMLNKALLKHHYGIDNWDIPPHYLCPPVPGRADYVHYMADLIGAKYNNKIKCLDIGSGANCIYPIIGCVEYGWNFVGSDIDKKAVASAQKIVDSNVILKNKIELRLQTNPQDIFRGIIQSNECFDISICNPPFHSSLADAEAGSIRKLNNLKNKKINKPVLNFAGQANELYCEGGEEKFIQNMMMQSVDFSSSCLWFSTLVSKQSNLKKAYQTLKNIRAREVKTIDMAQGNKSSRILAWTFLSKAQQVQWLKLH